MAGRVNEALARGGKALFIFGDPLHAVMSTLRNQFNKVHFRNCGCAFPRDLLEKDWLHYEQMFDSWMKPQPFEVLRVRYETMPEHFGAFKEFLGFMPSFAPWRARAACPFPNMPKERLLKVYGRLADKIAKAPDVSLEGI